MPQSLLEEELNRFNQAIDLRIKKAFHPFQIEIPQGKKIRAELCFLFSKHFGLTEKETLTLAFAIEGVHTGSLLLDDMIDGSLLRRGKKALWSAMGHKKTVSLSLLLLSRSLKALQADFPSLGMYLVKALEKMSLGESFDGNERNYQKICYEKTGVLFTLAALLPALLKKASLEKIREIYCFSKHMGIAYQIKDDIEDGDSGLSRNSILKLYDYHVQKALKYLKQLDMEREIYQTLLGKFEAIYTPIF